MPSTSPAEEIRSLGQSEREKYDNMPEGLQQGETGQTLDERANNCESWADEVEQAGEELDNALEEFDSNIEAWKTFLDGGDERPEGDEPEFDATDDSEVESARQDIITQYVEQAEQASPF